MLNQKNNEFESFSVRKIPTIPKEVNLSEIDDEKLDKIKILELCNHIDEWEKEVLFSENGFFSTKGKEVKNKSKEFISELDRFISSKISSMNLFKK